MRRPLATTAALLIVIAAVPAAAMTCVRPPAPAIPNPAVASNEEMAATMRAMDQYQRDMNTYLECVDQTFNQARAEGAALIQRWNQVVDAYNSN